MKLEAMSFSSGIPEERKIVVNRVSAACPRLGRKRLAAAQNLFNRPYALAGRSIIPRVRLESVGLLREREDAQGSFRRISLPQAACRFCGPATTEARRQGLYMMKRLIEFTEENRLYAGIKTTSPLVRVHSEFQARQGPRIRSGRRKYFLGRADFSRALSLVSLSDTEGKGKKFQLDRKFLHVRRCNIFRMFLGR